MNDVLGDDDGTPTIAFFISIMLSLMLFVVASREKDVSAGSACSGLKREKIQQQLFLLSFI